MWKGIIMCWVSFGNENKVSKESTARCKASILALILNSNSCMQIYFVSRDKVYSIVVSYGCTYRLWVTQIQSVRLLLLTWKRVKALLYLDGVKCGVHDLAGLDLFCCVAQTCRFLLGDKPGRISVNKIPYELRKLSTRCAWTKFKKLFIGGLFSMKKLFSRLFPKKSFSGKVLNPTIK